LDQWFEITVFENDVVRLREPNVGPLDSCNIWLVKGSKASLLIDTGIGVAPLAPLIAKFATGRLICLLTHSHYDHIGGAHEFADRHIHAAEAEALANPTQETTLWRGWLKRDSFLASPSETFLFHQYEVRPAPPHRLVSDGDRIDLGDRLLEVFHVPGHSPGLVAVFDRVTGALFTSDAIYDGPMFFDLPGSDRQSAKRSVARLAGLGAKVFYPGHFESFGATRFERLAGNI
jgi:glyoxylase-like metal-dependent hydrolase (beta-lactamase superfamily II)